MIGGGQRGVKAHSSTLASRILWPLSQLIAIDFSQKSELLGHENRVHVYTFERKIPPKN